MILLRGGLWAAAFMLSRFVCAQWLPDTAWFWPSVRFYAYEAVGCNGFGVAEGGATFWTDLQSDALPLPFSLAILRGSYLDSSLKQEAEQGLQQLNHARLRWNYNVYARWLWRGWSSQAPVLAEVRLGRYLETSTRFTDDAFGTLFFGNARYAGTVAYYDKTAYGRITADYFSFSLIRKFLNKKIEFEAGAGISAGLLLRASLFHLHQGQLFTASDGTFLDASYAFTLTANADSASGGLRRVGWLSAAQLYAAARMPRKKMTFAIWANDLGVLHWGKEAYRYTADTSVRFTGIAAHNLFSPDHSNAFLSYSLDSLLNHTGAQKTEGSATVLLPARWAVAMCAPVGPKWSITAAAWYELFPARKPELMVRPAWHGRKVTLAAIQTLGGISGFSLGADVAVRVKSFGIRAATGNLLAFLLPAKTGTAAVFLNVGYSW
ncbi:MAG: hypothetical protein NZL95_04185 [Chitinophagales bacterium]|nr:hypothetical protein [Chitinophagales bacterium]MDW8427729.1 hypothetical protein [Chitinophagales bacterium]